MAIYEIVGYCTEAFRGRRRLDAGEGFQTRLDPLDALPGLAAGLLEGKNIGVADFLPDLLTGRVPGDDGVSLPPLRGDANAEPAGVRVKDYFPLPRVRLGGDNLAFKALEEGYRRCYGSLLSAAGLTAG